jgi:autotransporter-associated beta strand protein
VTVTGDPTFTTNGASSILGPSGTGNVIVLGSGNGAKIDVLTITSASTYVGTTTVGDVAGLTSLTLKAGAAGAFKSDSAFTVNTASILDLNGTNQTIGSLAGAGSVTSSVVGGVTLTTGGDNTSTTFGGVIQNGNGTVALTKAGSGIFTLTGTNTYTGTTTINAGTLRAGSATGLASGSAFVVGTGATAATLDLNGNNSTIGSLAGNANGVVTNSAAGTTAVLTAGGNNTSTTFAGTIQNGGPTSITALTKAGTGTLTLTVRLKSSGVIGISCVSREAV